jgi:hypothetical protein
MMTSVPMCAALTKVFKSSGVAGRLLAFGESKAFRCFRKPPSVPAGTLSEMLLESAVVGAQAIVPASQSNPFDLEIGILQKHRAFLEAEHRKIIRKIHAANRLEEP